MSFWKQYLKPIIVLVVICGLIGALLAGVNAKTAPLIAQNEIESNNQTYKEALPEAEGFEEMECQIEGVTAVLHSTNDAGYVITAQARGYGGYVPVAVAFSEDGQISKLIVMENDETPGLGQKVRDAAFTDQFTGKEMKEMALTDIDAITGATISSVAVLDGVNLAVKAYEEVVKGGNS